MTAFRRCVASGVRVRSLHIILRCDLLRLFIIYYIMEYVVVVNGWQLCQRRTSFLAAMRYPNFGSQLLIRLVLSDIQTRTTALHTSSAGAIGAGGSRGIIDQQTDMHEIRDRLEAVGGDVTRLVNRRPPAVSPLLFPFCRRGLH